MGAVEVEVTTCGQTVPHGARGYLAADLDCTGNPGGFFGGAIVLERGAQLDLRGFTLTGDAAGAGVVCGEPCGDQPLSICKSSCKIFGSGGAIVGTGLGIYGNSLDVHDVTITGCTTAIGSLRRLTLRHATISANAAWGILAPSCKPKIYDSTITDSGSGVNSSYGVLLKHSNVTGNIYGDLVTSRRPKLVDSTCGTSAGAPPSGGTWGVCTLD
jgi:hypothetical protein